MTAMQKVQTTDQAKSESRIIVNIPDSNLYLVFAKAQKNVISSVYAYANEGKELAYFSGKEYKEMLSECFTESEMKYLDEVEARNDISAIPREVLKDIIALRLDEYALRLSR